VAALAWILFAAAVLALVLVLARCRGARRAPGEVAPAPSGEPTVPLAEDVRRQTAFEVTPRAALLVDAHGRLLDVNRAARDRFPFLTAGMGILEAFGNAEALVFLADTTEAVEYQELRSQFVANVSHELRTPLAGLRGMLEGLEDPEMPAPTRARFAGRARHEAQRLEALIADILFLSELEAMQAAPSGAVSDLSAAAHAAAADLADQAETRGVAVTVAAPEAAWTALTDRMARTVASNLLENAVRYAGQGSRATVTARREGADVVLEVSDDGAGIPERHVAHIFERFYRADPSRSKELGGTGLGLSIVKHIVERFGGSVEARSREGFGTTVRITLPAADPPRDG
jgi:two-component system phosphate regulon sensor histidine kinase PhoR